MRLAALVYDFPHKKSQEGLFELCLKGFKPSLVIGAPKVKLKFYQSKERIAPRGLSYGVTEDVCRCLDLPYVVSDHNSGPCRRLLEDWGVDLAVILGARIIRQPTIDACRIGIMNMHPGILPRNRGLDNLKWSILENLPIGVTTHLIDAQIDRGRLLGREEVPVYLDDTIRDVFLRQQATELKEMLRAISRIKQHPSCVYKLPKLPAGTYYGAVPQLFESGLAKAWERYKHEHGQP